MLLSVTIGVKIQPDPPQVGRFDRPLLKCYKSTFCAALAPRLWGASLVRFGVITDRRAAASSWWNVNNLLFGRAKLRLAEIVCRKRLPPASSCPVNAL